jgi:hypothetical protein
VKIPRRKVNGLPKLDKPDLPLKPVVSYIGSPWYNLEDCLHKIPGPLVGNIDSFVKNPQHFIKLIQDINRQNEDYLVNFDVVSLFTNTPVEDIL